MPKTDALTQRLLALTIEFSNAERPLSNDYLHVCFYEGLSTDAFSKQFRRDRERLVLCGLTCIETSDGWVATQTSFADTINADPLDVLALDLMCLPLTADASFPYRQELRLALAKMDRAFAFTPTIQATLIPSAQTAKTLTLLRAHALRHLVKVRYCNAKSQVSEYRLALYGEFGLRGHVYFVGSTLDDDNRPSMPHTYRDDRFRKVKELPSRYEIPDDFSIDDWKRLPFQVGDNTFEAIFALPDMPSEEVRRASLRSGQITNSKDHALWRVPAADVRATASWAIAENVTPVAPTKLVDAWRDLLKEASCG